LNTLFPAIRKEWPDRANRTVIIQHDNASPHKIENEPEIQEAGNKYGWNISIKPQPPNSPDFNILDLGMFRTMQSLQWAKKVKNIDEMILRVEDVFFDIDPRKLNDNFLTYLKCMESAIESCGGNQYEEPHMGKDRRRKAGEDVETVFCAAETFKLGKTLIEEEDA